MTEQKKIIYVEFDGVLHSNTSGWKDACEILDPPVEGAILWLIQAARDKRVEICIYSSRPKEPGVVQAMQVWLRVHLEMFLYRVWFSGGSKGSYRDPEKEAAHIFGELNFSTQSSVQAQMTIDSQTHCFQGKFRTLDWYLNFKPWNKRKPESNVPDYDKNWNQDDEDLADETLECLLNCLITDRDGFTTFEPSALEYMASMFMEARKNARNK